MKKLEKGLRFIVTLAGVMLGPGVLMLLHELLERMGVIPDFSGFLPWVIPAVLCASAIITGIISFILSKRFVAWLKSTTEQMGSRLSPSVLFMGVVGLVLGLIVAFLLSMLVDKINIPWLSFSVNIIIYLIFAYVGIKLGAKNSPRVEQYFRMRFGRADKDEAKEEAVPAFQGARAKILDTSVIIDGRIFDILKTGIIEGTIVIPQFVLGELRHIADSADSLKRAKGRRGLDILNRIQQELSLPVEVSARDYEDIDEVDAKLLRMAEELGGVVITNDFNLNKVAQVQGVSVFNINELSNAVKPVFIPGEELTVAITREGKEPAQGVAYLDDGTMIVVENGRGLVGSNASVVVTSVLQTAAGRMIFARVR